MVDTFRSEFIAMRAPPYAAVIPQEVALSDNGTGFKDLTKIYHTRPGVSPVNRGACYSGLTCFICLIYQTLKTPDGLPFHIDGPQAGLRQYMTLYGQDGLDLELRGHLVEH